MTMLRVRRSIGRLAAAVLLFTGVSFGDGDAQAQFHPFVKACKDTLGDLKDVVRHRAVLNLPWNFRPAADQIDLEIGTGIARLLPFGDKVPGSDQRRVVIPADFPLLACELSMTTYLVQHNRMNPAALAQSAQRAASCLNSLPNSVACLVAFGHELAYSVDQPFMNLSVLDRTLALNYFSASIVQSAMHEYAHHFMGHYEHVGPNGSADPHVDVVDAEFLADSFAMSSGGLTGDPENAMYYFFYPLSMVEQATVAMKFPDHETFKCRSSNVVNLVMAKRSLDTSLMKAFAGRGGTLHFQLPQQGQEVQIVGPPLRGMPQVGQQLVIGGVSPAQIRQEAKELFASPAMYSGPPECTHFKVDYAQSIRSELREFYDAVDPHLEALLVADENLDGAVLVPFLSQLEAQAERFRFLRELPALGASLLLERFGKTHRKAVALTAVRAWLSRAAALDGVSSRTYGRLLAFRGEEGLEDETGVSSGVRMMAGRVDLGLAVHYNPELWDAWSHLGSLDVVQGNCPRAAQAWRIAAQMSHDDQHRDAFLRGATKLDAATPAECAKQPHIYPGL